MKTSAYIFKTRPHLVAKVWGGRRLAEIFGKDLPRDNPYGESWEVADLDEGQSAVATGPLAGSTLGAVARDWRRALVGHLAPREDRFPLLVKLLDAQRDLSVQVHPGREEAKEIKGASSKDEAWLILHADEGAKIIHGLSHDGVSAEDFRLAVEAKAVAELLEHVPVAVGDVIRVEPGTIHAICAGVALLEIQEPSDTTFRVYDYDRPGLDGEPRRLHLDEALQVAQLKRSAQVIASPSTINGSVEILARAPGYRIERLRIENPAMVRWQIDPDSAQILHVLEGRAIVEDGIGSEIEVGAFESAVIPASMGSLKARFDGPATVIVAGLAVDELVRGLTLSEIGALTQ